MASGIEKVIVEIVGKADSAVKAFGDAGTAAEKFGTKSDKAHAALSKVSELLKGAVVAGAAAAAYGLLDCAKAAASEEQEMAVLANTLREAAGATDDGVASTEAWITAQQNATGISDGDLRPALSNLVVATKDIGEAQGLMATAMDISVGKGLDLETVTNAMAKAYNGNTGALSKLGIATKDAEGKALSFEQIMANASQVFGGSAAAAADTTAGKFAILSAQFADIKETVGAALLPVLERLAGWLSQAATWFGNLSPTMQAAIPIAAAVALGLGALLVTIGPLLTVLPALGAAFTIATGPIGLIVAAIAAVIAAGVLLYTHWDEVKAFAISTWDAIKGALETAWNAIKTAFDTAWGAIQTAWDAMWTWVSGLPATIIGVFADAGTWLLDHGKALIQGLWDGITEIWTLVTEWFGKVYGWVTDVFSDAINWLVDHGGNIISGLWNGIKNIWESVSGWLSGVYGKVVGFFSDALSWLKQKGEDIISGLWDGNKSVWENVTAWFSGMGESIKGLLDGAGEWLKGIGRSIMDGLLSGLKAAWTEVSNWVSGLGQKIKNLKGPIEKDRVLLTAEGEAIIHGLAVGMSAAWPEVERTLGVMNTRLSGGFDGRQLAAAYGPSSTVNNNQRTTTINVSGNDGLTVGRQIASILAGV